MNQLIPKHFKVKTSPIPDPKAVVPSEKARFTVLTARLIRLEYSPTGVFDDRPTQVVWFRALPVPDFTVKQSAGKLEITTQHLHLVYQSEGVFNPDHLSIRILPGGKTWHYGDVDLRNLKGTGRTLDGVDGPIPLEPGLVSRSGWKVLEDTPSLVFNAEGWLEPRLMPEGYQDLYFFGYGAAYQASLDDFCKIAGHTPLIPRWVLGNWWSRYWEFTQEELGNLMKEFQEREVPLSVCIIDMDWHLTGEDIPHGGWTGYTWNEKLFPDRRGFLRSLHSLGLKTALNLHPAAGVLSHEAIYPQMAEAMGIDPRTQEPVKFDIENPQFLNPYFDLLHHPYEADGIDFWWMDWQQGNPSSLGINLLWWINHLHFMDIGRDPEMRPFIFSRWGGLGNHRYPIGFSGDSVITWSSLAFQPYMTSTAANVGFGWWSHDIGGHMNGVEDAELYTRWVQLGVFSPVFRFHCTKNPFLERRPWGYDAETFRITKTALQLRHAMIPYLYSMAWKNATEDTALVRPMYYLYPEQEPAYHCPNQYLFGSELIAAPFITPRDPDTRLSRQVVWLPEGDWYNFFDGQSYPGDAWYALHGDLDDIPVFAKAGALVPLGPMVGWGGIKNPASLRLHIFPGADNRFELYEDDGVSQSYLEKKYCLTPITQKWTEESQEISVGPVTGDLRQTPERREYTLVFHAVHEPEAISVTVNQTRLPTPGVYDPDQNTFMIQDVSLTPGDTLVVALHSHSGTLAARELRLEQTLLKMITAFRMGSDAKHAFQQNIPGFEGLAAYSIVMSRSQMRAILETITGAGVERISNIGEEPYYVFWNNLEREDIRYLAAYEWRKALPPQFIAYERSALPRFKVVRADPEADKDLPRWLQKRGESPALWQLSYGDLLKVVYTRTQPNDPYPRPEEGVF